MLQPRITINQKSQKKVNVSKAGLETKAIAKKSNLAHNKFETISEKLDKNILKVESFRNLTAGWNGSEVLPFKNSLLLSILHLLPNLKFQPKIFPTGRQSIQFEYEKPNGDYLEFEIFENTVMYLSVVNDTEIEKEIKFDVGIFNELIDAFHAYGSKAKKSRDSSQTIYVKSE